MTEKEILNQLKVRIEKIEHEMDYEFYYYDTGGDCDGFACRVGANQEIKYEFWIEDGEIKYEISLFDNFANEYFIDGSQRSSSYQLDEIYKVAELIYNFAY